MLGAGSVVGLKVRTGREMNAFLKAWNKVAQLMASRVREPAWLTVDPQPSLKPFELCSRSTG